MNKIYNFLGKDSSLVLTRSRISSIEDILILENKRIQELTNFQIDQIKHIKIIAAEEKLSNKIKTADRIPPIGRLSTGCKNIDVILNGGIALNGICELYGCSGVGKTQFCLQLALQIQLPLNFGGKSKETVFPYRRLVQLTNAWRKKCNFPINFEDHIHIKQVNESTQMLNCLLNDLPNFMAIKNIGLIIIDSIAGLFRADNKNIDYVKRSLKIRQIVKHLNMLQDQFSCFLFIVNQVTDNLTSGKTEPYLGLTWSNNIVSRFSLSRLDCNQQIRKFQVVFDPELESKFTNVIFTENGMIDFY